MSLFSLFYRDKLQSFQPKVAQSAVVEELDNLTTALSAWVFVQHNEDGTHNTRTTYGLDFVPVGGMVRWGGATTSIPAGWLLADGAAVSRAAYPLLFTAIGITAGSGDGSTTFNLPNVANFMILVG